MNSRKDVSYRAKYVSGRKKWAKKFLHRRVRRDAKINLHKERKNDQV